MPAHNFCPLRGELRRVQIDAPRLSANRLGDPSVREMLLYIPPEAPELTASSKAPPVIVALAAFTGSGLKLANWRSFSETLPQRLERLMFNGAMGPTVLAMPDAFTSLGGNQYVDSPVMGPWSSFVKSDVIAAVEAELGEVVPPARRGVMGHSSGGYGALMQGLRHPGAWGAIACHSADMGFDWLYRADLPKAARAVAAHGASSSAFLEALRAAPSIRGEDFYALMMIAMAASYDPRDGEIELPIDLETCELDLEAWSRWLAHDPVHIAQHPEALRPLAHLAGLYIDCGTRDEYNLHFGARRLSRALTAAGIDHTHAEYDGGHSNVAHRYDHSLPFLYAALTGDGV